MERELKQIITSCCNGEEQGKKYLYLGYYSFVMGVIVRYVGKSNDAEELVNDCFIKIFKNIQYFRTCEHNSEASLQKALKCWMAKIASRTTIDFLRIAKNNRKHEEITDHMMTISALNVTDKIESIEILQLLNGLPQIQKVIFNLFEMDGYSHKEISEILAISEKQSSVYLGRAKNRLRILYLNALKLKGEYHA